MCTFSQTILCNPISSCPFKHIFFSWGPSRHLSIFCCLVQNFIALFVRLTFFVIFGQFLFAKLFRWGFRPNPFGYFLACWFCVYDIILDRSPRQWWSLTTACSQPTPSWSTPHRPRFFNPTFWQKDKYISEHHLFIGFTHASRGFAKGPWLFHLLFFSSIWIHPFLRKFSSQSASIAFCVSTQCTF